MRPFVIVTVQNNNKDFVYDFEVPTSVPAARLANDIKDTLFNYNPNLNRIFLTGNLYCERLHENIPKDKTFLDMGIWNGDVIVIS